MVLVVFSSHAPFADTNTSPRRHQVSSGAHHGLLVSSMMWVDRMLFFFLSVIPSLVVFFLITFTTNEILPSATLAAEWLTGSTGMSTLRDSFAAALKRLNWLGMTLLVRNSLVRNKMLRNAYHNCVLSLTTFPPIPSPKGKKIYPFPIKNFFLHANT